MKYNIEHIIKGLEKAKKAGKVVIDEKELIKIATPQINDIDRQIGIIKKGINKHANSSSFRDYKVTYNKAEKLTGIPRKTFYRWEKECIITRENQCNTTFDLIELIKKLIEIKKIRG
jgi:hypothetical protein